MDLGSCPICSSAVEDVSTLTHTPEAEIAPGVIVHGPTIVLDLSLKPCGHQVSSMEWTPSTGTRYVA